MSEENKKETVESLKLENDRLYIKINELESKHSYSESEVKEVFKWLLGYYDFPERPESGKAAYWWRTELRQRIKELGINLDQ